MKTIVAMLLLATSACAQGPASSVGEMPAAGAASSKKCDAASAQSLLGQESSTALGAEAMQRSGAETLRWIPEGASVTMDYSEARLNIQLDRQNKAVKIYCG